ncbi:hypothetical protein PU345_002134 [Enterobacter kobei]|nr:hypothetical protein [Enterobacter kobei]
MSVKTESISKKLNVFVSVSFIGQLMLLISFILYVGSHPENAVKFFLVGMVHLVAGELFIWLHEKNKDDVEP